MYQLLAEQELFLGLLASAIGSKSLSFKAYKGLGLAQWQEIQRLAQEQTVFALVADQVLTLPKECLPPRSLSLSFLLHIQAVQQANEKQNKALGELKEDYEREAWDFLLLKGQSLARFYPNPLLRTCGDIDVYLYKDGDYEASNRWAVEKGYRLQGSSVYEQLYFRGKVAIENHRLLMHFGREKYDRLLAECLAPILEGEDFDEIEINGLKYKTLPLEFNAVYVFLHILHHFSYLGIGLRQVCDWLLFLKANRGLDRAKFQSYVSCLDLTRPMELFALMSKRHLGMSEDIFPFELPQDEQSVKLADLILEDIFRGGNFGFETFSGKKFKNIWMRRIYMFRKSLVRSWKIGAVAPEHIRITPLVGALTRIKLSLKELFIH